MQCRCCVPSLHELTRITSIPQRVVTILRPNFAAHDHVNDQNSPSLVSNWKSDFLLLHFLFFFLLPWSALGNSNNNQKLTKSFCPLFPPSLSNQYFSFFYSLLACVLCAYNKYHTAKRSILYTHTHKKLKTNLCIFRKLQASILSHSNREAQKKGWSFLFFSFLANVHLHNSTGRERKERLLHSLQFKSYSLSSSDPLPECCHFPKNSKQ